MKPVLIQHLYKKNKGKYKATPTTKEEADHYNNKFASFVFWFVVLLVTGGLILG
jgi:hypothetical protein